MAATNDLEAIEARITAQLGTVGEFKEVTDYEPLEFTNLPAASIFYAGFRADDSEMPGSQQIVERWILRVYVALRDPKQAQQDVKRLVPKVREAFRSNRGLDGTVLYCAVTEGDVVAVFDKNNPQLMAILNLEAITKERP